MKGTLTDHGDGCLENRNFSVRVDFYLKFFVIGWHGFFEI